jgi:hypothetical protein
LFSVQVLCYGDHLDLAQRCLGSIEPQVARCPQFVQDIRIGLNRVSPDTLSYVREWAHRVANDRLTVMLYRMDQNACKYPVMRKMFRNLSYPLPPWVMWFDDDSYIKERDPEFFATWAANCNRAEPDMAMVGENDWERRLLGNQAAYFRSKPWWRGLTWGGRKGPAWVPFITGGWWILRREIIDRYDWPDPDLHHNGGDQLLGVLLRQQGFKTRMSDKATVAVNADDKGQRSRAKRRGHKEKNLGEIWNPSTVIDHGFHCFPYDVEYYPKEQLASAPYRRFSGL